MISFALMMTIIVVNKLSYAIIEKCLIDQITPVISESTKKPSLPPIPTPYTVAKTISKVAGYNG
jgi:hypothetical protein